MTIRDTLQSVYPDSQFMGTRHLGANYTLCRGMNGFVIHNRLTGTVVCTWDSQGFLYANSSGLSSYEKRLVSVILRIWRDAPPIKWNVWGAHAARMHDRWGHEYALVSTP
jgi:hypothetical protein|nr:MAG TPA: hypothetical protein [Caudoviricetes sp.]